MMEAYLTYLIPVLALAFLSAGWMAVQLIAKKMNIKNHIDQTSGCCGACNNKETCKKREMVEMPESGETL